MTVITFTVEGAPVAKGRPRSTISKKGGKSFIRHYTPDETTAYEERVAWSCKAAMRSMQPFVDAVAVAIDAHVAIPASWSNRKRAAALAGVLRPTTKPDIDNYVKALCDGMNSIAFADDAQIVTLTVTKRYSDKPRAEVRVALLP